MTFYENWAEVIGLVLLVVGFILAAAAHSAILSYIVIFLCGMVFGRLWYQKKHDIKFPYVLLIVGFLIGYLLGTFYGNKKAMVFLFILATIFSYFLHDKKIVIS